MYPCPSCKSDNTTCFDERVHIYQDRDNPEDIVEMPAGYFKCRDCGVGWIVRDVSVEIYDDITHEFRED